MSAIDKQLERAVKVAQVIAEHPDLPIKVLVPSTPSDYDTYYYDAYGASVRKLLFPKEVNALYGDFFGLDCDRYYDDVDELAEIIESYYLWDGEHGVYSHGPRELGRYMYPELGRWEDVYQPIADMMAEDMPWHEYIVIDCY